MEHSFYIYNTLSRKKDLFIPINDDKVGMYVCGPTVYGDAHLGHARPAVTFDILFRWLKNLGYKVRYVRNITDVGHLENDADEGDDKIAKKARLEQIEPMEVVQFYTLRYQKAMGMLNVLPPSIEPRASGHILEQIEFVKNILKNGYAYISNGSVYFDVEKYNAQTGSYGKLSGRNIDELLENTRELDGQNEKRKSVDFALWKKAAPEHIMRWKSEWSDGFPGWHLECSAMGTKYLGEKFDIHGGGMDLMFPHHECEIAQSNAALGHESVKYWVHNNMITINGQKMGKSLENFITLEEFFTGNHALLSQPFSAMTVRFFILQAHYRSTLDFSSEALVASQKGLERLIEAYERLQKITPTSPDPSKGGELLCLEGEIRSGFVDLRKKCEEAMNDDLNTPIAISHLFDAAKAINTIYDGKGKISAENLDELKSVFNLYLFDILGLKTEKETSQTLDGYKKAVDLLLNMRLEAKQNKDWALSDKIRNELSSYGFNIKDTKEGFEWSL